MIGFYNHTVILTYMGLFSSLAGMIFISTGHPHISISCLLISGLCDMFDGKVARACKTRSESAEKFGVQIDSLCDVICFSVFPAYFVYEYSKPNIMGMIFLYIYVLAGVIRLAYFNVLEEERRNSTTETTKYYAGLPVTTIALLLPLLYSLKRIFNSPMNFKFILPIFLFCIAILNITNFKVRKPGNKTLAVMCFIGLLIFIKVFVIRR